MAERVATLADAAQAFRTFADAEGARVPTYAAICRIIADDPELHGLLLHAPTGQRLPVLLLAAIHEVVLTQPDTALAPWYPSVSGRAPSSEDPGPALRSTIAAHRDRILGLLRTRQVQTNEVNRCCAWWIALTQLTAEDPRPVHLVEIGASAGLNLLLDRYRYTLGHNGAAGVASSPVHLGSELRGHETGGHQTGGHQDTPRVLGAAIVTRVGLDQRPLDITDPADARWLEACVWPEQRVRFDRLTAALGVAALDPPRVVPGDLVDDLSPLLDEAPDGSHVVVLSSWVLAYVSRERRSVFLDLLSGAAVRLASRNVRLTLLTLEAASILDLVAPPPLPADASADEQFASILAITGFSTTSPPTTPPPTTPPPTGRVIARCQAHLVWTELLG